MSNDLFAPPTDEERKKLLFAPPSEKELDSHVQRGKPSGIESLVSGAAQGATLGHADELAGVLGAAWDKGEALLGKRGDISFSDAYQTRRDAARRQDEAQKKANPKLYTTGQIGGGVLSAAATGGMGAVGNTQRAVGLATGGGALAGSGFSDGDLGSKQHAMDTGIGGALGAATFGIGTAAGSAIKGTGKILSGTPVVNSARNWTSNKLADVAAMRAAKAAIGQNKKMAKEIAARPGGLKEFGRKLITSKLDDGSKVMGFGNTTEQIGQKAIKRVDELGPRYDEIFKQVDELAPDGAVDPKLIAQQIMGKADDKFGQVANKGVRDRLYKEAEGFIDMPQNLTMRAAQKEKNAYRWTPQKGLPSPEELRPDLQNQMKNVVGDQIDAGVEKFGGKELADQYRALNKDFGHIKSVANAAEDRATQDFTNRMLSPTDYGVGMGALLKGGANFLSGGKAALAAGLHNQVRTRGSSATAITLDSLSKALKTMPESFGKYGNILQKANERGAQQLGLTHHILWKNDPEYKALFSVDRAGQDSSMSAKPLKGKE